MEVFEKLQNCYIIVLNNLISFFKEQNITPYKYIVKINLITEKYIKNNSMYFIELGLKHILPYKTKILNIMEDENNIDKNKLEQNFQNLNEIDIILDVIMNLKQLEEQQKEFIKSSIEVLILTLEKIQLFLNNLE